MYAAGIAALTAVSAVGIGVASASSRPSSSAASAAPVAAATSLPASPSGPASPASAAGSPAAPTPAQSSPGTTKINTDAVEDALKDYAADHGGNVSIAVYDRKTGLSVSAGGSAEYQTASIVKVDIVAALMLQHQAEGTSLTAQEKQWAHDALTRSDNDGATNLYAAIGGADGLSTANQRLGLVATEPCSSWGMTTTTVDDQIRLLRSVSSAQGPLSAENRQLLQGWMGDVISSQYFGVPSGETSAAKAVYVKVGWVDLDNEGGLYATNAIGRIVEPDHDWLIAVLSDHNKSLDAGKTVIDGAVAEAMRLVRESLA
jgi:beta-lactamase class A